MDKQYFNAHITQPLDHNDEVLNIHSENDINYEEKTIEPPNYNNNLMTTLPEEKPNKGGYENYFPATDLLKRAEMKEGDDTNVDADQVQSNEKSANQGTLLGVFIPVLQNIFGVLLFIRVAPLTAECGLGQMLIIVVLSCSTTFITILSMCAIATNGKIKKGGSYFMISRSLGPAFGDNFLWDMRLIGLMVWALLISVNFIGLKYVARTAMVFLSCVLIAIVVIYLGCFFSNKGITGFSKEHFSDNWEPKYVTTTFYKAIGVYFPSVTGVMAGANRSGDLADAKKSIPKGTIAAQLITSFVYLTSPILFAGIAPRSSLIDKNQIFAAEASLQRELISVAIIMSSTGAGLQSLASAPRILQAICEDKLLPISFFGANVRRPLALTAVITAAVVLIGNVDDVAPIITMFFLLCYLFVNTSCFILDYVESPNWRPSWKYYHKITEFLGMVLCVVIMFLIGWWWALIAICLAFMIFLYITRTATKNWGDMIDWYIGNRAIKALATADKFKVHVKNWRPHILAICPFKNESELINYKGIEKFLIDLQPHIGLVIYGHIELQKNRPANREDFERFTKHFKSMKSSIVVKPIMCENFENGISNMIQTAGLGCLNPNTLLLPWPKIDEFLKSLDLANMLEMHVLVLKAEEAFNFDKNQTFTNTIDIWSFAYEKGLKEMIAHILKKTKCWKKCSLRLFVCSALVENSEEKKKNLEQFFKDFRILTKTTIDIIPITVEMSENFGYYENQKPKIFVEEGKNDLEIKNSNLDQFRIDENRLRETVKKKRMESFNTFQKGPPGTSSLFRSNAMIFAQAKALKETIIMRSKDADLVLTNLPLRVQGEPPADFLKFCEIMTSGLKRIIMMSNPGREIITEYT